MNHQKTINQPENRHITPILVVGTFHLFIKGCKIKLPSVKVTLMNGYLYF